MALPRRLSAIARALCAQHAAIAAPPVDRATRTCEDQIAILSYEIVFCSTKVKKHFVDRH